MEIKDYIKHTLLQIAHGAQEAHTELFEINGMVPDTEVYGTNPNGQIHFAIDKNNVKRGIVDIEFDIAVSVSESSDKSKGAELNVASLIGVGGKSDKHCQSEAINKIDFSLPMVLPPTSSKQ